MPCTSQFRANYVIDDRFICPLRTVSPSCVLLQEKKDTPYENVKKPKKMFDALVVSLNKELAQRQPSCNCEKLHFI